MLSASGTSNARLRAAAQPRVAADGACAPSLNARSLDRPAANSKMGHWLKQYTRTIHQLLAVFLVGLFGACSTVSRIYRETWQPVTVERSGDIPRVVTAALVLKGPEDIDALRAAGATLIGWHEAHDAWALRAGSTGGTHFVPVAATTPTVRTGCYSWGDSVICSSREKAGRWSRVAVFRVEPERWESLPPHLIPPEADVTGVGAYAVRVGCRDVQRALGTVTCGRDWQVVDHNTVPGTVHP